MSPASLVCYGMLLPLLLDDYTPAVNRLCVVKESVVAIKTLVGDSPENLDKAVACGAVPVLVHLVATGDATLAWQAADALSNLTAPHHIPVLLCNGVVQEVTQLLQESADALHLLTVRKQLQDHAISGAVPALPTPHAAYAYRSRQKKSQQARVQLVGRQAISFSGSSCMYTVHDSYSMCDYCVPSACLRALLRVLGACTNLAPAPLLPAPGSSSSSSGAQQQQAMAAATGAGAGALPDAALSYGPAAGAQRFVAAGGLYALFLLLHHELCGVHHSKMASSLISLLNLVLDARLDVQDEVLQGNSANKLVARERGLIPLLAAVLAATMDPDTALVLDDRDQVLVCVLDVLVACVADSQGNVEALVGVGGLRHVNDVITLATSTSAGTASGQAASGPASKLPPRPGGAKTTPKGSLPVLVAAVRLLGHMVFSSQPAQLVLQSGPLLPSLIQLADAQPTSPLAQSVVTMCCQLMAAAPHTKAQVIACNLLPLLLKMLEAPAGPHTAAACQGLYALCIGDVDQQNEVVAGERGGLRMLERLVSAGGFYAVHALWLLCALLHGNSYAKNAVRAQCPAMPRHLLACLAGPHPFKQPDVAVAAAHAIAHLCQSNHANQEAIADSGALEAATAILQALLNRERDSPGNSPSLPGPFHALAHSQGGAQGGLMHARSVSGDGSGGLPPEVEGLGAAVAYAGLLDAVLRMLASLLEFNASNQKLARECGCLGMVSQLLLRAAEVRDLGALRRAQLLPALAGACAVVARAAQDCEENQRALVVGQPDLAPALFRLLSLDEPYVVLEVAHALEHMVIRSDLVSEQGEDRAEFEADAIRSLVHVLHARGGGPAPNGAAALPPGFAAGLQAAGLAAAGFWAPSTLTSSAAAAPSTVAASSAATSASVKEASTVLVSVVQAAIAAAAAAAGLPGTGLASITSTSLQAAAPKPDNGHAAGAAEAAAAAPPPPVRTSTFARIFRRKGADGASAADAGGKQAAGAGEGDGLQGSASEPGGTREQQAQNGTSQAPAPVGMPQLSADHAQGLVTLPSLQHHAMSHQEWLGLVGHSAAAFQPIARQIADSPWRPVKVQLAWLLFLLAARTPANRGLISKLERSVVAPLAAQLANAESFFASEQAAAALAEVAEAAAPTAATLPVSIMAQDSMQRGNASFMGPSQAPLERAPSTSSVGSRTSTATRGGGIGIPGAGARHTTTSSTGGVAGSMAFSPASAAGLAFSPHAQDGSDLDPWDANDVLPPTPLVQQLPAGAPSGAPVQQAPGAVRLAGSMGGSAGMSPGVLSRLSNAGTPSPQPAPAPVLPPSVGPAHTSPLVAVSAVALVQPPQASGALDASSLQHGGPRLNSGLNPMGSQQLSEDDELEFIRQEVQMLAGVGGRAQPPAAVPPTGQEGL